MLGHQGKPQQPVSGGKFRIQFSHTQSRFFHFPGSLGVLFLAQEHGLVIMDLPIIRILCRCLFQMRHGGFVVMAVEVRITQAAMRSNILRIFPENFLEFADAPLFVIMLV